MRRAGTRRRGGWTRRLPGRPISAISDRQAIGASDAASVAVWRAHVARMIERVRHAPARWRPICASPAATPSRCAMWRWSPSRWRCCSARSGGWSASPRSRRAAAAGAAVPVAAWEGWVEPPAYTGKPSLYLADIPEGQLAVPQGSLITIRLYGEIGKLIVDETVSGRTGDVPGASEPSAELRGGAGRQAVDPRPRRARMEDHRDPRPAADHRRRRPGRAHGARRDEDGFRRRGRSRRHRRQGADRAGPAEGRPPLRP